VRFFRQDADKRISRIDTVALEADGTATLIMGNDPPMKLDDLQARVGNYVAYALDGEMTAQYPETVGHPVRIVLVVSQQPTGELATYVHTIPTRLAAHGVDFKVKVVP
jgi:hypothetical protein